MQKITGIGGFFFLARDPRALARWYEANFGIDQTPTDYDQPGWQQQAGTTVFAPFPHDTTYFGNASKTWMLNFRVNDLAAMIEQLRDAGIEVNPDPKNPYPNGSFAHLHDPEGNRIELWQPASR